MDADGFATDEEYAAAIAEVTTKRGAASYAKRMLLDAMHAEREATEEYKDAVARLHDMKRKEDY